jgi:hypothetical protein
MLDCDLLGLLSYTVQFKNLSLFMPNVLPFWQQQANNSIKTNLTKGK